MEKKKQQYALKNDAHFVRMQILIPREDYEKLEQWRKKTGLPKIDLIRKGLKKALRREERRLKLSLLQ